jgi:hypothetical protein
MDRFQDSTGRKDGCGILDAGGGCSFFIQYSLFLVRYFIDIGY